MIYLAENLRTYRKQRGLTQEDVAEAVFVTTPSVSKWERGETVPDVELLPALARLLRVSVDALIGMDRIYADEARREVFCRAHAHFEKGEYAAAAETHREALHRFPKDDGMLCELALALALEGARLDEAIGYAEQIVNEGSSVKTQHTARAALCLMYGMHGMRDKAEQIAGNLPHVRESREEVSAALAGCDDRKSVEEYLRYLTLGHA